MMRQRSRWKYQHFLHNLSLTMYSKLRCEPGYCAHSKPCVFIPEKFTYAPHSWFPKKGNSRHPIPTHPRVLTFSSHFLLWPPHQLTLSPTPALALLLKITRLGAPVFLPFPKVQLCSFSGSICL